MKFLVTTALALGLAAAPAGARAQDAPAPTTVNNAAAPSASDLLFDAPQMRNVAPGSTLTYAYLRRSGIAKGPYGPPMTDTIVFHVDKAKLADARDIRVTMFSGFNRVPAGPFEDMPGNPVISLFLENHLKGLAKLLEANPRYLKNAIRKGLRDKATVTPTKVTFQGHEIDGWRVVTRPFEGDAMTERMRGLSDMTYTFVTAPEVPGEIVSIEAQSKTPDGGELLEEKLSYEQKAG